MRQFGTAPVLEVDCGDRSSRDDLRLETAPLVSKHRVGEPAPKARVLFLEKLQDLRVRVDAVTLPERFRHQMGVSTSMKHIVLEGLHGFPVRVRGLHVKEMEGPVEVDISQLKDLIDRAAVSAKNDTFRMKNGYHEAGHTA